MPQSRTACINVRYGSLADISEAIRDVRLLLKSGRAECRSQCPFIGKAVGVIRPQYGMIVGVGDRDGERGAKTDAVFGAFDTLIDRSVHETPPGL